MADAISKSDLVALFRSKTENFEQSSKRALSDQNGKDMAKEYYVKTNQSLVQKIRRLELELARSRKLIAELQDENAMLRLRASDFEGSDVECKVDKLVKERIERKMDRLDYISRRTVAYLEKTAEIVRGAFEDIGVQLVNESSYWIDDDGRTTGADDLASVSKLQLECIRESPPLVTRAKTVPNHTEDRDNSANNIETPTGIQKSKRGPRRSELFGRCLVQTNDVSKDSKLITDDSRGHEENFGGISHEEVSNTADATPSALPRRQMMDTPAVPWKEADSVRRKRTATLKIKTLAEPKLNNKLRRPGRNDEPHPFISMN